ncbi:unnamed protein product [Phyllotreta striolata]|uniref:Ribokinase n=1 Tax=Phyllotreta striolata TaxID=444603 RepID=A0A9N9XRE2_PHYSR|nr:unnamed protein product [Phyllotreta striolata]
MTTKQIVTVGSCNIDLVSYAPRIPNPGETIHGREFLTFFGGKGANQCVAVAKLGGEAVMVARVGDDIWGPKYLETLQKENVITKYVLETEKCSTGVAQIIVGDDTGQNQIVITAGANGELKVKDIDAAEEVISQAGAVIMQLETAESAAIRAMELCKGVSILNGAPGKSTYDPKLLTLPTIFCVNETEASIFSGGLPVSTNPEIEAAAAALMSKGCQCVIITLGEQGAFYIDKNDKYYVSSNKVKCVDSTGAGDAFIGALAYLLVNEKDMPMKKAIELACFAAADSVTRPGAQPSFPDSSIFKEIIDSSKTSTDTQQCDCST